MANPATYDIKYYKGDTFSMLIYPKTASGTPFDLTDFTLATLDIADKRGDDPTREKYRIDCTIDASDNSVLCVITPTAGNLLNSSKVYVYDITVSGPATHTFLNGTITVIEAVVGV
jgi:hypothetical protein